jgi:glutathione S-transferase
MPTDAIERFRNETLRVFGVLEIRLSGRFTGEPRDYLVGEGKGKYSIADIGTWTWVKGWEFTGFTKTEMEQFPHLLQWLGRIAARPAVQKGIGAKYARK